MAPLYMLQLNLDPRALLAFAREQGLDASRGEPDLGYLGHAWLRAAFTDLAPRPWRLFMTSPRDHNGRPTRLLAYSEAPAETLAERLACHATPGVQAACSPEEIVGKPLPDTWPAPRRYGFEVLCCPVGRKNGSGTEKDLFLLTLDRNPDSVPQRSQIYADWCRQQIQRIPGVDVIGVRMEGFRLQRILRKTHAAKRQHRHGIRPQALLRGELLARSPEAIPELLRRGIGRHRAFGFGMLLLRPA